MCDLSIYKINENNADIIIKNLWLGNYKAALDIKFLTDHNIKYIVNVTDDIPCMFSHIQYVHIPIKDKNICFDKSMIKIIDNTLKFIHQGLCKNVGVLVHCKKGHHRSAGIIMAFLMKYLSMSYLHSMLYINSIRPKALRRNTCMCYWVYNYYVKLISE